MKITRILFEAGPMVDSKKTGVGYFVQNLAVALARSTKGNIKLTGYYFNFLSINKNNVPEIQNLSYKKIWLMPGKLLSISRRIGFQPFLELFTLHSADIVLFTNYVTLPLIRRRKIAVVIYDLSFIDHPEYVQGVNLKHLTRFCPPSIRKADIIFTISDFTKQRILANFSNLKANIVVMPIPPVGLTITNVSQKLNQRLIKKGIAPQEYILYLGTIEPRKNLQNLIIGYSLMDETIRQSCALVLAGGKGWKDEEIEAEIVKQQNLGINIILTGYVNEAEKHALYNECSGFVLPSHYEGFGMPILEAMQHKVPVAVSDIPVFREVAHDAALYFQKDDPHDISQKLEQLVKNADLKREILLKSSKRLQTFSWDENASRLIEALNRPKL